MIINVGSQNKVKLAAVTETLALYPELFPEPQIRGVDVDIDLFGHPTGIDEVTRGAIDRAKKAHTGAGISVGLEGGLMEVPHCKTGYMEVNVCAIYDGEQIHLGVSSGFEWPTEVTRLIVSGQSDASQAFKQLALTHEEKLGATPGGIVGLISKGRMTREDQIKQSIITALIQRENSNLYE